jgi:hypothetical protein
MLAMLADPVDEDDVEAFGTEGRLLMLQHRLRERDAGLRRRKIEAACRDGRALACEPDSSHPPIALCLPSRGGHRYFELNRPLLSLSRLTCGTRSAQAK